MAEEESQEEGIAYTITAGFYPELASAIKWGIPKKGTAGGTGRTYARKTGFSHSSINRMIVDEDPSLKSAFKNKSGTMPKVSLKNKEGTWYGHEGFNRITRGMRAELESTLLKGETPSLIPTKMTGDAGIRKRVSMTKWLGGSEMYRLWGTRVWYQAGIRNKKMLLDAVKRWNGSSDYISQLYKDTERDLVVTATNLAEEIFGGGEHFDKKKFEKDFQDIVSDPDVAEETMEEYPKSWKMGVSDKMIDSRSAANKIDMMRTLEDGTKEYIDVTEMPITAMEQHGISAIPKELKEAIDELKGEGDKTGLRTLKNEVVKMILSNMTRDNKLIDKIVKAAEIPPPEGKKVKNFEQILKAAEKDMKAKGKEGKVSRVDISSMAGVIEEAKGVGMGAMQSAQDTADLKSKLSGQNYTTQAAMAQVVHVLASLGDEKGSIYRQGFRVTEPVAGRSVYASVPMTIGKRMRFLKGPVKKGTVVRAGYSHTLMLREKEEGLSKNRALARNRKLHQSYSRAKINGVNENGRVNSYRAATLGVQTKGSHHSTTVTFSPKGMAGVLERAGKAASWDISKINKNAKTLIRDAQYSWGGRKTDKFDENSGRATGKMRQGVKGMREGARFWALPYIGVLDNQYHAAAKKKK